MLLTNLNVVVFIHWSTLLLVGNQFINLKSSSDMRNIFYLSIIWIFLPTSFFATSLSLLKSPGTGNNLSTSNLSTLLFKFFKLLGTFFNISISNLPASDFKLAKSTLLANCDLSTPAAFFKSAFAA